MSKPENPPAFPRDHRHLGHNGMSLRDWFAGQAIAGMLGSEGPTVGYYGHHDGAERAYRFADAMLAERAKPVAEQPMQHVAYFDEGEFHWMSGIAPRECELYAPRAKGGEA